MPIAVGRKLAALADAPIAKMMGRKVTSNVAVGEEVVAIGRRLVALADALIAKTMGRKGSENVAAAVGEGALQELPVIGTAAVVLAPVGKKVAHSSARRRRGPTIGCACQCERHQGRSTTKVRVFGQLPQLAIRFGLAVLVAESAFC